MSIYFALIIGRIGCFFGGYLVCLVCGVIRDSVYMVAVLVSGCCVDVLGGAPGDYAI